ncbi:hypothetical protein KAX75_06970, partial [candidate division WOR-3 bacterium]|nr:hypothetical protein [candidate division WOR-3 bacterium]
MKIKWTIIFFILFLANTYNLDANLGDVYEYYKDYFEKNNLFFDSLNVQFVGNWPFGPPQDVAFDSLRNFLFCGSGGGVYILDISNPSSPDIISEKIHTRGVITDLFYDHQSQNLFITYHNGGVERGGFEIWDVSDPYLPNKLGFYYSTIVLIDIFTSGIYAYVAATYDGIYIFDISDPSNIEKISCQPTKNCAMGIFLVDSIAYVVDGDSGMRVIDVSLPTNPYEISSCIFPGYATEIDVSGNYAFIAAENSGLRVVDISDSSSPQEVGFYNPYYTISVFVKDTIAYNA